MPVNVGEAIEEVKQITAQGLQKKEVIFEASFDEAVLLLEKDLFISLLVNLVDNAAKASQAGGHIRLTGKCEENRYAIMVRDEGKGIPESEIKNILEPFYMVDKSRARKEGGAGLGTVSYTHLDVYKRQLGQVCFKRKRRTVLAVY